MTTAWTDERLERIIGVVLRTGVILAAAVVLLGGICHLVRYGNQPADYRVFHAAAEQYRSVTGVIRSIGPSNCSAVMQLGLLILIATPILRVAVSLAAFWLERDRAYVALTAFVLAILLYSIAFEH